MRLADLAGLELTYPEVGASVAGEMPTRYDHLELSRVVGRGDGAFGRAREAVLTFAPQRGLWLRPQTTSPRAAAGVELLGRLGPLRVPCRVVWADEGGSRAGFAYGTLPGHPEIGEESFVLTRRGAEVVMTVRAFSRPAHTALRLVGPVAPTLQRLAARRYLDVVARAAGKA